MYVYFYCIRLFGESLLFLGYGIVLIIPVYKIVTVRQEDY